MNNQGELVFVKLIIPLIGGMVCFSDGLPLSWYCFLVGFALVILMVLILLVIQFRHLRKKHRLYSSGSFNLFCFLLGGWLSASNNQITQPSHFSIWPGSHLKVQIIDEPQVKNNIIRLRVKVLHSVSESETKSVSGQLLISIQLDSNIRKQYGYSKFNYGDQIFVPANYKAIAEPRNPYEFDVRKWYNNQNFYHQQFVPESDVLLHKTGMGNPIIAWALQLRKKQVNLFRSIVHNDEANAVASTLILGYRADLSEETLMAYTKTGTIHALSVSGMHVALIYIIINFMLSFLDRWPLGRIIKLVVAVALIWLYALIAGLAPSVLRSAIMLTIFIIGKTFNRHHNAYNLLCFSAFMMLLFNPHVLYDIGFQLSYLSVLGLIFLQPLIYGWFIFKNYLADKIWSFFALSFAAQLSTFPLAIYYFHQFPVYFLLSNLFILIPVTAIMYLGLVILICRIEILGPAFEWLINFTNLGLKWIAGRPWASLSGIWINQVELLLLSLAVLCGCLALLYYNKKLLYLSVSSVTVMTISLSYTFYQQQQQTKIIFFSLRNHTATAFIHHDQAWLLTSLERNSKAMKNFVNPALEQSGVKQINYLDLHRAFSSSQLHVREHQIQFSNYTLLVADSCFNGRILGNNLAVDAITLSQQTNIDLRSVLMRCRTKQLIIDGSNSAYRRERYNSIAENYDLPVYDLGIKKAYLVNLTK